MTTNTDMDDVFQALANETRREILDLLRNEPGQAVGKLASQFDVSRIAIMNHLNVLEKAGLVTSQRNKRSRLIYPNIIPIQMIYERWTDAYSQHWSSKLTTIKYAAEKAVREKGKA